MKPRNWVDIYPHGTKEGDEELKFFIALARNPKYVWRSTSALAKETGLSKARVEEIIQKYYKKGMVFQNPKNEDQFGYWTRIPAEMLPDDKKSISGKDQHDRVDKIVSKDCAWAFDANDILQLKSGYGLIFEMKDECHAFQTKKFKGKFQEADSSVCKGKLYPFTALDENIQQLKKLVAEKTDASNWLVTSPEVVSIFEATAASFAPTNTPYTFVMAENMVDDVEYFHNKLFMALDFPKD
jgi:hypothetical protein